MMMLGVPLRSRADESDQAKAPFRNELEAHLKPLEVAFAGRYVVLAEDAELMFGNAETTSASTKGSHLPGLSGGSREMLRGDKKPRNRWMNVRAAQTPDLPREDSRRCRARSLEGEMGHTGGSSARRPAPILGLSAMKIASLPGRREGDANALGRPRLTAGACGSMAMHISFREPRSAPQPKGEGCRRLNITTQRIQTSAQGIMIGLPDATHLQRTRWSS